ncbi:HlyD family secretion protein [Labilibaculum antarcticum]|uniref:Hemolysin secretion protein D n=1 Tax=Labilibaculum antarcticum TaxID=1717717 RepID=A0A1Y1CDK2_9BACT|nr:efflux RND transporter periplasmic adaptor subunit [Labilibaculum antarcticum]BAX78415.1 hemolysin secretion protein D [Labilibaculum antarcticum]
MNKTKTIIAGVAFAAIVLFFVYTGWILSKPMPMQIQGEVEATQFKVASKLIGRIDSLPVHKGESIKKGDLLFTVSSPEVEAKFQQAIAAKLAAQAEKNKAYNGARSEDIQAAYNVYLKAEAATEFANKTFKRIDNLFQDGVVPAQKRDEIETKMKVAQESAKAAKAIWEKAQKGARVEDKEAAGALVKRAEAVIQEVSSYLSEMKILSPADGEVANIIAERGELIPAGYPVITLVDLDDVWVTFNIREDLLSKVRKGSILPATFPALGNKTIKLEITFINVLGDYANWNATKTRGDFDMKTFEIHARPTAKVDGLRPGMSALVNWDKLIQ